MRKETYIKLIEYFETSKIRSAMLEGISKLLPLAIALVYACLCAALVIFKSQHAARFIVVPVGVLIFVTALRTVINRPRPYTKLGYTPFLKYKEGKGQSFPSRHTASAFIIAFACLYIYPMLGIIMLLLAVLVAASRIITGMHYISDILAGILCSFVAALFGFWII